MHLAALSLREPQFENVDFEGLLKFISFSFTFTFIHQISFSIFQFFSQLLTFSILLLYRVSLCYFQCCEKFVVLVAILCCREFGFESLLLFNRVAFDHLLSLCFDMCLNIVFDKVILLK